MKVEADLSGNAELLEKYEIKSIPTIILLIGDEVYGTVVGLRPEDELREWIDLHLALERGLKNGS